MKASKFLDAQKAFILKQAMTACLSQRSAVEFQHDLTRFFHLASHHLNRRNKLNINKYFDLCWITAK